MKLMRTSDLSSDEIREVLSVAADLEHGGPVPRHDGALVGLVFLSASLRTRLGYTVATARLGGQPVDITELRWAAGMSAAESWADTLRTASGMVDVVVARTPFTLDPSIVSAECRAAFVNGGDAGGEHPTQALVDVRAMEAEQGPIADLHVAICGDLGARTVTSLLATFELLPPRQLSLIAPPGRDRVSVLGPRLAPLTRRAQPDDIADVDVLYLPGLPEGEGDARLGAAERARFAFGPAAAECLSPSAVVLSPLPVIDEVALDLRSDGRVRMFEQSDRSVFVRMAVLDLVLTRTRH